MSACSECGRPFVDWQNASSRITDEAGNKVLQHAESDRLRPYREWRMRWGVAYVNDVPDQLEYRNGRPVAALELTRCDKAREIIPPGYLARVWERMTVRDRTQYESLVKVSRALDIPGYIVVFSGELDEFHVRQTTWDRWVGMDRLTYRAWLGAHR